MANEILKMGELKIGVGFNNLMQLIDVGLFNLARAGNYAIEFNFFILLLDP